MPHVSRVDFEEIARDLQYARGRYPGCDAIGDYPSSPKIHLAQCCE